MQYTCYVVVNSAGYGLCWIDDTWTYLPIEYSSIELFYGEETAEKIGRENGGTVKQVKIIIED